jgi:hypothetical protein
MKTKDQILLEEAYYAVEAQKKIENYIKQGSKGDLDLERVKSGVSFPDNFVVNGFLNLRDATIKHFPDNMTINGNVDMEGAKFKTLPKNFKITGKLDLRSSQLTSLPDNLTVGESLIIGYTDISSLPKNLKIGEDLFMPSTNIQLKDIKHYINIKMKVHSNHFSNEEFQKHNEKLKQYKELNKKLPELKGVF